MKTQTHKEILDSKKPKGYTLCMCGMTATKLDKPLEINERLVCDWCKDE